MNTSSLFAFACGAAAVAAAGAASAVAQPSWEPNWRSLDRRPVPEWFLDAKFGVLVVWGVHSVPAWAQVGEYAEWYWNRSQAAGPKWARTREFHAATYGADFDYRDFAPLFRAELFDAERWAGLFARAGARYVVPTAKHHDGFALWPSAEASRAAGRPWNAAETGPRRDLLGELAAATRARGLAFGVYFSLYEWHNPLWKADRARYVAEHMMPQFKDLVVRCAPSLVFADGEWDMDSAAWRSEELLAWLFNEAPCRGDVVVNDRWGKDCRHRHGGYWTTEYGAGLEDGARPWEESRGMAFSYGLNRAERIEHYKSGRELVLTLIDLVSRGGNFLLGVGPAADGTIPPVMEERLLEIGAWLAVNGEAIYGTRGAGRPCQWSEGERPVQAWGEFGVPYDVSSRVDRAAAEGRAVIEAFFTQKPGALYAITPRWPGRRVELRGIEAPLHPRVTLLGLARPLEAAMDGDTLSIALPEFGPEEAPCRHAFAFKIEGASVRPRNRRKPPGSCGVRGRPRPRAARPVR
jgi:alpha-L-fucosidase